VPPAVDEVMKTAAALLALVTAASCAARYEPRAAHSYVKSGPIKERPVFSIVVPSDSDAIAAESNVIVVDTGHELVAVKQTDGKPIWRRHGVSSPLLLTGRSLAAIEKKNREIVRLDLATGATVWRSQPLPNGDISDIKGSASGYAVTEAGALFIVDAGVAVHAVGDVSKSFVYGAGDPIDDCVVVANAVSGGLSFLAVTAYSLRTGNELWESAPSVAYWMHGHTVVIQRDMTREFVGAPAVPAVLEYRTGCAGTVNESRVFAPDQRPGSATIGPEGTKNPKAGLYWPDLLIGTPGGVFHYNLRESKQEAVKLQPRALLDSFHNGLFLLSGDEGPVFVRFTNGRAISARVPRSTIQYRPPSFSGTAIAVGDDVILVDSQGTSWFRQSTMSAVDLTEACHVVIAAAPASRGAIAALCRDGSSALVRVFR